MTRLYPAKYLAFVSLAAALTVVGCSRKTETTTSDSTAATTATDSMGAPAAADTSHNANAQNAQLSDANILALLSESDSSEIVQGKLVQTKSKNADVKSFGSLMITDHSKLKKDGDALAKKLNLTPQPPANDPVASDMTKIMSELNGATDPHQFDSIYVNHAVEDHQNDLNNLHDWQGKAQNADLKDAIGKAIPVVQKHLDRAKAVQSKLASAGQKK